MATLASSEGEPIAVEVDERERNIVKEAEDVDNNGGGSKSRVFSNVGWQTERSDSVKGALTIEGTERGLLLKSEIDKIGRNCLVSRFNFERGEKRGVTFTSTCKSDNLAQLSMQVQTQKDDVYCFWTRITPRARFVSLHHLHIYMHLHRIWQLLPAFVCALTRLFVGPSADKEAFFHRSIL
jgi:hypothetical protein